MSTNREEMAAMVADVVAEHFERLRADIMEKLLRLRTPRFSITPKGELYVDGELAGDVRPVFQSAVNAALKLAQPSESGDE